MKIIGFDEIQQLNISSQQCYQWVDEVLHQKEDDILPAKISMKPENMNSVFMNVMPSILPKEDCAGVKVVTRYPQRNPSIRGEIMLYRLSSGECIALLDGNWITTMRTGAVAVHSIMNFAVKGFQNIGVIGLGNTARATMQILLDLCKDREFNIFLLKYKDQHELFEEKFKKYKNAHFVYCNNAEELVSQCEVVVSAVTFFSEDICPDSCFPKGCLLVPIHTRGFSNCDLFFDKVYADDKNHVRGFKNFDKFKKFAEVAQVLRGEAVGRESDDERILIYNIGISLHDIYFANKIEKMCSNGTNISLNAPTEKFWV